MEKFYECDIAGRSEKLPIIQLPTGVSIAFLIYTGIRNSRNIAAKKLPNVLPNLRPKSLLRQKAKGFSLPMS